MKGLLIVVWPQSTLYSSACLSCCVPSPTLTCASETWTSMESTISPCSWTMVARSLKMVFMSTMSDSSWWMDFSRSWSSWKRGHLTQLRNKNPIVNSKINYNLFFKLAASVCVIPVSLPPLPIASESLTGPTSVPRLPHPKCRHRCLSGCQICHQGPPASLKRSILWVKSKSWLYQEFNTVVSLSPPKYVDLVWSRQLDHQRETLVEEQAISIAPGCTLVVFTSSWESDLILLKARQQLPSSRWKIVFSKKVNSPSSLHVVLSTMCEFQGKKHEMVKIKPENDRFPCSQSVWVHKADENSHALEGTPPTHSSYRFCLEQKYQVSQGLRPIPLGWE